MPVPNAPSDLTSLVASEAAAERALAEHRRREAARHRGVAWSGFSPEMFQPSSCRVLQARAEVRAAARDQWMASADGTFLTAIAACQAAAQAAHALGERARAGAARGETAAWRREILRDLTHQAGALTASLRQAGRAIGD